MRLGWCFGVVALVISSGCRAGGGNRSDASFVESAHVRLYHSEDAEMCPGAMERSVEFLEAAAEAIAMYLEMELPPRIDYWWVPRSVWPEGTPCPGTSLGCTDASGRIFATLLLPHELVHSIALHHFGVPRMSFFEEGLAEAVGGAISERIGPAEPIDFDELLAQAKISREQYTPAAELAGYLLFRHGVSHFLELLKALPRGTDVDTARTEFARFYDASLEEVASEAQREGWSLRALGVAHCGAAPPLFLAGDGIAVSGDPGCGGPAYHLAIDVEETRAHRIEWRAHDDEVFFHLRKCPIGIDGSPESEEFFGLGSYRVPAQTTFADLRAGRYLLSFVGEATERGNASFELQASEEDRSCEDPVEIPSDHHGMVVAPEAASPRTTYFRLREDRTARALGSEDETSIELCRDCSLVDCTLLGPQASVELVAEITYALTVRTERWGGKGSLSY